MAKSGNNYDKQVEYSRGLFIKYDPQELEKKAKHLGLTLDEDFIYFSFVDEDYRIGRKDGMVAKHPPDYGEPGGFNDSLSIFDVLCCNDDYPVLARRWASIPELNPVFTRSNNTFYDMTAAKFAGDMAALEKALISLGGEKFEPLGSRDLGYIIPTFSFLPCVLLFNDADDEFPAQLSFLWDRNVLSFIHFETIFYVTGHLLDRILDISEK